jgi:predicted dehydrogenase
MSSAPLRLGIIGVGKISEQYFESLSRLPGLELVAVADLDVARAAAVAAEHGVESMSVDALLADARVEAILNLTIPAAHVDIDRRALEAGKHVYAEKPLGLAPADAIDLLRLATERGLRLGSAPDTVLGTGIQTARATLDAGVIGTPVAAAATWVAAGHERWHPAPDFYYQPGAGPLFDMGPYYVSTLVTLLGPVATVVGLTSRSERERVIATGPRAGSAIDVDVDTHVIALLEHESGATSTVTMSFEVWASRMAGIEIYGTAGALAAPDPNRFSDPVEVFTESTGEWRTVPTSAGYADAGRGYGLADMAHAIATDRPHRASAELAFHVLEIMDAILRAGRDHSAITISSTTVRPEPVPNGATPDNW